MRKRDALLLVYGMLLCLTPLSAMGGGGLTLPGPELRDRPDAAAYSSGSSAPQEASAGLIDTLDDFDRVDSKSNLYVATNDPAYFGNDKGRFARSTADPGSVLYRTGYDIHSFAVHASFFVGEPIERLQLSGSSDGRQFEELAVRVEPVGDPISNWQSYVYEASAVPEGTRYLKITLVGADRAWTPQLTKVVINRNTASVKLDTTRLAGGVKAALSSDSDGARIYYRLNGQPRFLSYRDPLLLRDYTALEAYAVKDGLEPSPVLQYTVNAGGPIRVDRFGQMLAADFAEKVTDDMDLTVDAQADAAYYNNLQPPADRDRYGGLADSASEYGLRATGYFAVQRAGDRIALTTPEGNLYFSLAVNVLTAQETYTRIAGREQAFESILPFRGEYRRAYMDRDNYSFYLANKFRKSGVFPTDHAIYVEAIDRLHKWGFNGAGGFSPEKYGEEGRFPYVRMLPLGGMDWAKVSGLDIFDIFAPEAEARLDRAFRAAVAPHADDRMLIGYFIGNEYDYHAFHTEVPKLKAGSAAIKGELVKRLERQYRTIDAFNDSWQTSFRSFDELKDAQLAVRTAGAWRDMDEFFAYYLDKFYGTVERLYRKYDSHHLLLGDRWMMSTILNEKVRGAVAEAEGRYVDAISINYYTHSLDPAILDDIHAKSGGKPVLISEFGFGTEEQGLDPLLANAASDQHQRGMRYRNYVEAAASLPYVVGAHLFNYVDQASLGRYWQGEHGERYNSGLVNVADRPYKEYLQGIMDTNYDIYKVMLGERPAFAYDFTNP